MPGSRKGRGRTSPVDVASHKNKNSCGGGEEKNKKKKKKEAADDDDDRGEEGE